MQHTCCAETCDVKCENKYTRPYIFDWHVEYPCKSNEPKGFTPYKSKIGIFMCPEHYKMLLKANNGDAPVFHGPTEEAVNDVVVNDYLPLAYEDAEKKDEKCICDDAYNNTYGKCGGKKNKKNLLWRFRNRAKYGGETYFTILPITVCERHYGELLAINDGKEPECYGWDYWDALDSLVAGLDKTQNKFEIIRCEKAHYDSKGKSVTWNNGLMTMAFDTSKYNYTINERLEDGSVKVSVIN